MTTQPNISDEVEKDLAAGRHDEVLTRLEAALTGTGSEVLDTVGLTETAGDQAHAVGDQARALRFWRLALAGWEREASMATSGGEGRQRMLDVERMRGKLASIGA
jgi:hypothetical protein